MIQQGDTEETWGGGVDDSMSNKMYELLYWVIDVHYHVQLHIYTV